MLLTTLTSLLLSFTFSVLLTSSPLLLGIWILSTALTISAFIGLTTLSWVGFLVFLIYVGGILVIFAYFTAIQPNQFLQINTILYRLIPAFIIFIVILGSPYSTLLINIQSAPTTSIYSLYLSQNIPVLIFWVSFYF